MISYLKLPLYNLFFLFLFACSDIQAESNQEDLRIQYYRANDDSDFADVFYERMKSVPDDTSNARELGYKGIAALIQAKHSYNPYTKMNFFSEGRRLLESAIDKDRRNVELRFLRYTVQDNAPFFLDYDGNMEEDKKLITDFLNDEKRRLESVELTKLITDYLKDGE